MKLTLIATAVSGLLAAGGFYFSEAAEANDIVKTVSASQADTYAGFKRALGARLLAEDIGDGSYTFEAEGDEGSADQGASMNLEVKSEPNEAIDYTFTKKGAVIHILIRFEPLDGGRATRVVADINYPPSPARPGESQASTPKFVGFLFEQGFGLMVDDVAAAVESGDFSEFEAPAADVFG
jgi:hypothetical protein